MYQCLLPHSKCPNVYKTPETTELMFQEQRTHGKVWPGFQRPCPPTRVGRGHGLCALVRGGKARCDWCQWVDWSAGHRLLRTWWNKDESTIHLPLFYANLPEFSLKFHLFMFFVKTTIGPKFRVLLRWHTCLPPSIISLLLKTQPFGSCLCSHQQGKKREIKTYSVGTMEWTWAP